MTSPPRRRLLTLLVLLTLTVTFVACGTTTVDGPDGKLPAAGPAPLLWVVIDGHLVTYGEDLEVLDRFPVGFDAADSLSVAPGGKHLYALSIHTVHAIDLAARSSKELATLTAPVGCENELAALSLQSVEDSFVGSDGKLCVTLLDRNINMADLQVSYTVDVSTGAVAQTIAIDLQSACNAGGEEKPPLCTYVARPGTHASPEVEAAPAEGCSVRLPGGAVFALPDADVPCEPFGEGASASGRFLGISRILDDSGDYIYRSHAVIDVQKGVVVEGLTNDVVGESQIEWAPRADVLVVDGVVHRLGDAVKSIELNRSVLFVP